MAGRPMTYDDDSIVVLNTKRVRSRLQPRSDRRAIIAHIVDCGGKTTFGEIDDHFGYDIRQKVVALIKANWLEVIE